MRQSQSGCVVERRGAQNQRLMEHPRPPNSAIQAAHSARRIAEAIDPGRVAPENERNMFLQHDFERRSGSFNCSLEQWLEAGRWGGFAIFI